LGQDQQGVDLYGPDDLGRLTGVQCKVKTGDLDFDADIAKEVADAEGFEPKLAAYFVATTAKRDAKLQARVRVFSEDRLKQSGFPVGVIFWEDVVADLLTSRPDFEKHFPQLGHLLETPADAAPTLLCALDVGYDGTAIKYTMDLVFGEFGRMANEEPRQIDAMLHGLEASSRPFMAAGLHVELLGLLRDLMTSCHAAEWTTADGLATKIEGIIRGVEYGMKGKVLAAYTLGVRVRRWDMRTLAENPRPTNLWQSLEEPALLLFGGDEGTLQKLKALVEEYLADAEAMRSTRLPFRAYNIIRRTLLSEGMK